MSVAMLFVCVFWYRNANNITIRSLFHAGTALFETRAWTVWLKGMVEGVKSNFQTLYEP